MNLHLIYWPVLAQTAISIFVMMLNGLRKHRERRAGRVQPEAAIDNKAWSLPVILTSNSLENQFQFPVIFYVLCLVLAQLDSVSATALVFCWIFVLSRWVHAVVHVTSNIVALRGAAFAVSMLSLVALFVNTALVLSASP